MHVNLKSAAIGSIALYLIYIVGRWAFRRIRAGITAMERNNHDHW